MENSKSIVERIDKSEKMKIIKGMRKKSFLNYRDDLEKLGMKVDFATSPFSYYKITSRKWGSDSIYITSKKNVGSDAEYISNDNIAMGELTEIVQETMFNKMKAKVELKELVREVITEIIGENHKFKVGDEVKFNGNHDGVVTKVHTDGKLKGMIDVQKKGRSSTVTLSAMNKKEVRLAETINESEGTNINTNALSQSEIQLAVGAINFFGTGSHPMADAKGLKYFKVEYLADIIVKNKSKLSGDAKKHLANLLKKLQKSTNEDVVSENKDINFVLDQLANAVDLYPRDEFAQHMSKNTKYDEKSFEKLYDAYFKMKAMDRFHMATDIGKSKKFLKKFGISEEVQLVNEGLSDLEFVIDQLSNSMEHYDEREFVSHMSKETKYNASSLKKVFNAYWDLGARERDDMFTRVNTAKPWLKKFGIK